MNKYNQYGCIIKNRLLKLVSIYLIICTISILIFWIFNKQVEALFYSILIFYILLPISMFILSILIGKNPWIGDVKYMIPIILGIMYMLTEYLTFSLANMIAYPGYYFPDITMIVEGSMVSYLGLGIGLLIKK